MKPKSNKPKVKAPKSLSSANAGLRTWVEISRSALKNNYQIFRQLIGKKTKLMAVVKSNAYGHDIFQFAREMERLGADWLAVDSIVEGTALREHGAKAPILILGHTLPERLAKASGHNLDLSISTKEGLEALVRAMEHVSNRGLRFHLKIDTGMCRQGLRLAELPAIIRFLKQKSVPTENLVGIYTHFAAAKNPAFPRDTRQQSDLFRQAVGLIEKAGYSPIRHAAASSGTLLFPETHFDLVRIGISLYGLWPSAEVAAALGDHIKLQPVLTWKTVVGETKKLKRGDRIGYDFTETLEQETVAGICPIGYWHGYPRALSSIGHVLVSGRRCRILGRVSMDILIINLGPKAKDKVGEEVILIGKDGEKEVNADELAALTGTTNYEIVTRLNPLMKRIYSK
ncbi:MAG: alanine racemase [Patescibacteria group bacterium]|nr:alanine racemase [Patescibacteria group bacterium]